MLDRAVGMSALWAVTYYNCALCFDSKLIISDHRLALCERCGPTDYQYEAACQRLLEVALDRQERGSLINPLIFDAARALVRTSAARPLPGPVLQKFLGASEREVKGVIEALRADWLLPIGSSRKAPAGYFWITTPAEFEAWFRPYQSQALQSLKTGYAMMKANYPELAGQINFHFDSDKEVFGL
jgi:biotin operon repressor